MLRTQAALQYCLQRMPLLLSSRVRVLSRAQLRAQLASVLQQLKKFSHLNKKALSQYAQFSSQREELVKRRTELNAGSEAIQRVIDNLDEKKVEAIRRTLKDVGAHFSDVFAQLTGACAQCRVLVHVYLS